MPPFVERQNCGSHITSDIRLYGEQNHSMKGKNEQYQHNLPAPLNPGVPRAIAFISTSSAKGLSCKYSSKIS